MAWLWERLLARPLRDRLWAGVHARTLLEAGIGTGANLPHYPPRCDVTAIDLSPRMLERAALRARASRAGNMSPDGKGLADVQRLPFRDGVFDAAVATFVFCSVPDPLAGLLELRRVVRPGGMVHLLEQVRTEVRLLGTAMDLADPLILRPSGAHIARRTVETVRASGLEVVVDEPHGPFGFVRLVRARVPRQTCRHTGALRC